ncbi:MAG: transcription termination factor Rho [Microgenomates group bacterium]
MSSVPYVKMIDGRPARIEPVRSAYSTAVAGGPVASEMPVEDFAGILEISGGDGHGVVRPGFKPSDLDVYLMGSVVRSHSLRSGDYLTGKARKPRENDRYWSFVSLDKVNGVDPKEMLGRPKFERGTPIYPFEKIKLELGKEPLANRLIDLVAPIGRGQRGLIVSPPKAGKTTVIKDIAAGIAANYPEIHIMAVLVGERPEEVTDIARHIAAITKNSKMPGEVAASNFDEKAEDQTVVSEIALERAKRLVEIGHDVVILLDSVTRLARAYNLAIPTSGRTLSGGFDPAALYPPKRFFGAARKIENGGSLTIIGTALVDTGSRMDELIYEEFKGTGNMELHLDRKLAERRVYPAVDVMRSGTRREDLLFDSTEYQSIILMRRMLDMLNDGERTEVIVERLGKTKNNKEFLASLKEG